MITPLEKSDGVFLWAIYKLGDTLRTFAFALVSGGLRYARFTATKQTLD
jgi:hypothetical protein